MRQFRMPIQHTKNLSKFRKQIGSILKEFDEKGKYEAFSYLQGCISTNRIKRKCRKKIRISKKSPNFKRIFKCRECHYVDTKRKAFFQHLENHEGIQISCRKCKRSFNNGLSFNWHSKHCCRTTTTVTFPCTECPRIFFSKQNLNRHLEGHKRNNCTYCDQVITNRKHLIQHLLEVHSIKLERAVYKCSECDKRYVKERSLHYHKQQHFKDKFVCLDCGKVCENAEEMNEHYRKHELQKSFRCLRCNQRFMRRQQYLFHMKRHDNYKCITCNETFASKVRMMLHKQKGHNVEGLKPKFSCPECGKDFCLKSKLIFHLRKHTDDKPTLNCQYCDKTFSSPYAYYKHSTTMSHEKCSPETSVYICESCGSQFSKKYLLEQHNSRAHNNRKEYVTCEFCAYKTKNKANMNRHRDTHITNLKTFICEQCGKDFNNMASLKGHISYMHTDNKMFQCNECDKTFKRNSELVRHQGSHSNDRPHVCKTCGQSYKRSTHLRRHEKASHKIVTQSRNNVKLKMEADGSFVPVSAPKKPQQQEDRSSMVPVIAFVETEPLALVKRKECNDIIGESHELTYFDNIVTSNSNSALHDFEEEDIILGMSISNNAETQYFLSTPYTNDQLIQEYIGQDNLQFVDGHNYSVLSSNRYVLNNILNFIDSNSNDNNK